MASGSAVKLTYKPTPVAPIPKVVGTAAPKTIDEVSDALAKKFGADVVKATEKAHKGDPYVVVDSAKLLDVIRFLRDDERFYCTNLQVISTVDYLPVKAATPEAKDEPGYIAVVYMISSYAHRHQIMVKVKLDRERPHVASIVDLYRCANWYERECFDMTGVQFDGHPHMARILLPPDWVGHPLRRDYVFPEEYSGMKVPL